MDLLSDILSFLRLRGSLYFRTEFTSPWSVQVPAFERVARFHFAHRGRCLVRPDGVEAAVQLEQGDLIIIPRGVAHRLYCDPATEHQAVQIDRVVELSGFTGEGALIYGAEQGDQQTQLVCGHFAFDPDANHPMIDALPAYVHIRNYGETAGAFMEHTLRVIGAEAGRGGLGSDLIALKLSEIIFAQALRAYLSGEGSQRPVFAGLRDRSIARALSAIHAEPGRNWTLDTLAGIAGLSRTVFATRFVELMAMTPLAYLTAWRMQRARQMLAETGEPIIEIAEQVGYRSEAAFGRVFKKAIGTAPARYRRQAAVLTN
ncbi:AraC family transcriptional regulator [Cucumibacter marinus]|uniref:AraC family transcriptional regulator n=1 Tax=Cucumibacter marinus TaxID=1121252 RepID=UPI000408AD9E|nr:AraC family transcriptional regulator [Cucumibacter marinus]